MTTTGEGVATAKKDQGENVPFNPYPSTTATQKPIVVPTAEGTFHANVEPGGRDRSEEARRER